jgi:cation transport ATPase
LVIVLSVLFLFNGQKEKDRQYNGQKEKDRQYNDQKEKDRQYNGQKEKDRQYNGQKEKDRQYNDQKEKDRQYNVSVLFLLAIVLSVLQCIVSDYPFVIFKVFLSK